MSEINIMIVEDEPTSKLLLEKRLIKLGYNVCASASSGEEAIEKAQETNPDLILMDIMLEGEIDGIEAAGTLYHSMEIPVIYLTANIDDSLLERAKHTMPFGYLIKPISQNQLHTNIQLALHQNSNRREKIKEIRIKEAQRSDEVLLALDLDGVVSFLNEGAQQILEGSKSNSMIGQSVFKRVLERMNQRENPYFVFLTNSFDGKLLEGNMLPVSDEEGNLVGATILLKDTGIEVEEGAEEAWGKKTLEKLKNSQGIVSICSACKKIKDGKNDWIAFETYLKNQGGIKVSHGFCPHCVKELYPELYPEES